MRWEASSSPPASSCMWKMVFRAALCLSEADLRDSPSFSWSAEFLYSGCCPPSAPATAWKGVGQV